MFKIGDSVCLGGKRIGIVDEVEIIVEERDGNTNTYNSTDLTLDTSDLVDIPLELEDELLIRLSLLAHREDKTLNQIMIDAIVAEIGRVKNND